MPSSHKMLKPRMRNESCSGGVPSQAANPTRCFSNAVVASKVQLKVWRRRTFSTAEPEPRTFGDTAKRHIATRGGALDNVFAMPTFLPNKPAAPGMHKAAVATFSSGTACPLRCDRLRALASRALRSTSSDAPRLRPRFSVVPPSSVVVVASAMAKISGSMPGHNTKGQSVRPCLRTRKPLRSCQNGSRLPQ